MSPPAESRETQTDDVMSPPAESRESQTDDHQFVAEIMKFLSHINGEHDASLRTNTPPQTLNDESPTEDPPPPPTAIGSCEVVPDARESPSESTLNEDLMGCQKTP